MKSPSFVRPQPIIPQFPELRTTFIVSAFLQKASHMPRLHTARFSGITMKQEHLALLFQSNSLHTLILFHCRLPRSVRLPPSSIRHLTVSLMGDWPRIESFLGHCSANLEALDFVGPLRQEPGSTRLPLFPKLRKLKFVVTSGLVSHLDTLTSLAPQLEHLEVWGRNSVSGLSALPVSLNRLSINQWAIEHGNFGTRPSFGSCTCISRITTMLQAMTTEDWSYRSSKTHSLISRV